MQLECNYGGAEWSIISMFKQLFLIYRYIMLVLGYVYAQKTENVIVIANRSTKKLLKRLDTESDDVSGVSEETLTSHVSRIVSLCGIVLPQSFRRDGFQGRK